jgi:ribosome-binding factor A
MSEKQRARIEESIHKLVAELLVRRVKDPRVENVSITRVKASKDFTSAKILYNIIGGGSDKAEIEAGLKSCRGFIRGQLRKNLRLRVTPELTFIYDASLDTAMEIESLIQTLHNGNPEQNGEDDDAGREIQE